MPRLASLAVPVALAAMLAGCGGDKADFTLKPQSYALTTASPVNADGVVVIGVSRDGRLIGTYQKAGATTVFGWSADGQTEDLTLPAECKQVDGIDELGTVGCSDRTVVPNRIYTWHGDGVARLDAPASAVLVNVGGMSFEAGLAANITSGANTGGFQLKEDQKPLALTAAGGVATGVSQTGNIAGYEPTAALTQGVAWINKKKVVLGLASGNATKAMSVNDTGVVVGTINGANDQAFKWAAGKFTTLAMPSGATASEGLDVNNGGVVSGSATVGGTSEACVWFPQTGPALVKDLATFPSGTHLDKALLTTPLGIVICQGTVTDTNGTREAAFALFPTYP
jgi:hypothetical protein